MSTYEDDGSIFVPDAVTLNNGVQDFYADVQMEGQEEQKVDGHEEVEEEECEYDSEEEVYDMFAGLNLSSTVPEEFNFEEDYSHDEDAVLDNAEAELENVTPLKPCLENRKTPEDKKGKQSKVIKKLTQEISSSKGDIHIDLVGKESKERSKKSADPEPIIDLTTSVPPTNSIVNTQPIIDLTNLVPPTTHDVYDSELLNSDSTSFLSDSSSSTSQNKLHKYEKVGIDEQ